MMKIDFSVCDDTQLWELLKDVTLILKDKRPDEDIMTYTIWCKVFTCIRKEIDYRMESAYEN